MGITAFLNLMRARQLLFLKKKQSKQNHSQMQKDPANTRKGPSLPNPGSSVADIKQKMLRIPLIKAPLNFNKKAQSIDRTSKTGVLSQKGSSMNGKLGSVKKTDAGKVAKDYASYPASSVTSIGDKRFIGQKRLTSTSQTQQKKLTEPANLSKQSSGSNPVKGVGSFGGFKKDQRSNMQSDSEDSFIVHDDKEYDENISIMIRKMFGHHPNKFRDGDDEDDRNMEVSFRRIQAEERRSARIGKKEDERELALIQAEKQAERARKESKKRKIEVKMARVQNIMPRIASM